MIPTWAFLALLWAAVLAVIVGMCRVLGPYSLEERRREDELQAAALRHMRPGVCHDCGRDLGLIDQPVEERIFCASCAAARLTGRRLA